MKSAGLPGGYRTRLKAPGGRLRPPTGPGTGLQSLGGPSVGLKWQCVQDVNFFNSLNPPKKERKLPSNFLIELELTQSCCWLPRAETLCGPKQKVKQRRKKGKSTKRIVKFRKSVRQATLPLIGCADETKTDEVSRTFASIFPEQGEAFHSTGNATRATQFFLGIFLFCPTRSNEALKFQSNANFHEN